MAMAKRGRPVFKHQDFLEQIRFLHPDVKTSRGMQNKVYEVLAVRAIKDLSGVEQIFTPDGTFRSSIMIELGRLEDPETIRTVARHINQRMINENLRVKQAANITRLIRLTGELF